jgi:predicted transcriptional regulator
MRSANSAIETMQKVHSNKANIDARKELKTMDIDAEKEINIVDNQTKLVMSREEVMKAMLEAPEEDKKKDTKEDVIDI